MVGLKPSVGSSNCYVNGLVNNSCLFPCNCNNACQNYFNDCTQSGSIVYENGVVGCQCKNVIGVIYADPYQTYGENNSYGNQWYYLVGNNVTNCGGCPS